MNDPGRPYTTVAPSTVDAPVGDNPTPLAAGTILGDRYILLELVGEGGMGVVWRALDRSIGREVAIKLVRTSGAPDVQVRRFLAEAQACGRLEHPGIVPLYDLIWLDRGVPCFTMRLVRGTSLAELLQRRRHHGEDFERNLSVFARICDAVAYAHSQGVVHRDLKPSNVMLGRFGEVHVMDWGLAKLLPDRQGHPNCLSDGKPNPLSAEGQGLAGNLVGLTAQGSVLGTPAYMPPEQATGQLDQIDNRSDVFALGAILCEVLTGQPPYTGSREVVWQQATAGDLRAAHVRLSQSDIDPDLASLARSCLSPGRDERPADALELSRDLAKYFDLVRDRLLTDRDARRTWEADKEFQQRRFKSNTIALLCILVLFSVTVAMQVLELRVIHVAAICLCLFAGVFAWSWLTTRRVRIRTQPADHAQHPEPPPALGSKREVGFSRGWVLAAIPASFVLFVVASFSTLGTNSNQTFSAVVKKGSEKKVKVLAALRDIPASTVFTTENTASLLGWVEMPLDSTPPGAVTDVEMIRGSTCIRPLKTGQVLTALDLSRK